MKIAYLHGLESKPTKEKVRIIQSFGEAYAPKIDYMKVLDSIYDKLYDNISTFDPDIIIGSSLGALLSYHIGNRLNKDLILFNPPLYGSSVDIKFVENNSNKNTVSIYQGKNDNVVIPKKTEDWIKKNHRGKYEIQKYDGAHRVPVIIFKKSLQNKMGNEKNNVHVIKEKSRENRYVRSYKDFLFENAKLTNDDLLGKNYVLEVGSGTSSRLGGLRQKDIELFIEELLKHELFDNDFYLNYIDNDQDKKTYKKVFQKEVIDPALKNIDKALSDYIEVKNQNILAFTSKIDSQKWIDNFFLKNREIKKYKRLINDYKEYRLDYAGVKL